jgi:hypothetical protein
MSNIIIKNLKVVPIERRELKDFIEKWHYSKSINGLMVSYCFGLFSENQMIGAAIVGRLAMANQWKRFSEKEEDVLEIRRLCCIDETPKNTESYFISKIIKWLKQNTDVKILVSYADAEYGHLGTIYKASNFEYLGFKKGAKVIIWKNKHYHDKSIRTKYKGQLKPFAVKLKEALEKNEAYYKNTAGKHTYVYKLKKK